MLDALDKNIFLVTFLFQVKDHYVDSYYNIVFFVFSRVDDKISNYAKSKEKTVTN